MSSWSSLLNTAGRTSGGGSRSREPRGVTFDPRAGSADYSAVEANTARARERSQRDWWRREQQKAREEEAAAESAVVNRLEAEKQRAKVEGQLAKGEADWNKKREDDLRKEAESGKGDVAKKEASITSRVEEYDEKRADAKDVYDDRQTERQDRFRQDQENRAADQAANREQNARERARNEAASLAERMDLHKKGQELSTQKQRSKTLADETGSGEELSGLEQAQSLSDRGVPLPATREPFVVSDRDRPLYEAIQGGTVPDWEKQRIAQLLAENPAPQHTARPPVVTPFREPSKGRILEDYGPGTLAAARGQDYDLSAEKEWLKRAGPEEYRAYEAWKAGAGPRPTSLPEEAPQAAVSVLAPQAAQPAAPAPRPAPGRALSGRTATVAPSVRSAGLGGSNAAPPGANAPTMAERARARMMPTGVPAGAPPLAGPAQPWSLPQIQMPAEMAQPAAPAPPMAVDPMEQLRAQANARQTHTELLPTGMGVASTEVEDPARKLAQETAALALTFLDQGKSPTEVAAGLDLFLKQRQAAAKNEPNSLKAEDYEGVRGLIRQSLIGEIPELAAAGRSAADKIDRQGDPGAPLFGFAGPAGQTAAAIRGAGAGALEAGGSLLSFADLVPILGMAARGAGATKRLAKVAPKVVRAAEAVDLAGSAGVSALGAKELVQGLSEGDLSKAGAGLAMAGLGGVGAVSSGKEIGDINKGLRARGVTEGLEASARLEAAKKAFSGMAGEAPAKNLAPEGGFPVKAAGEAEIQKLLPRTKVARTGENTFDATFSNGSKVTFDLDKAEIVLSSQKAAEAHGVDKVGAGEQVVGRHLKLDQGSLIEILKGEGMDTVGHELVHFYRSSGLIADSDWARLSMKYQRDAAERAAANVAGGRQGAKLWRDLPAARRNGLLEEVVADRFGDYARARVEAGGGAVPDPERGVLRRAWDQGRDFYRQLKGGEDLPFERMLAGDLAEGGVGARAGRKAAGAKQAYADFAYPERAGEREAVKAYDDATFDAEHLAPGATAAPAAKGTIGEQFAGARAQAPSGSADEIVAGMQREAGGTEHARVRLNDRGEIERLSSGYEQDQSWTPERRQAQLDRIGGVVKAETLPDGKHTVGQHRVVVRDGQVTAAISLNKTLDESLPSPHTIRADTPEAKADMATLRADLSAEEKAAGKPLYQYQKDAVSPEAAEAWNRRASRSPEARADEEAHLHPDDRQEAVELQSRRRGGEPDAVEQNLGEENVRKLADQALPKDGGFSYRITDGSKAESGHMVSVRPDVAAKPIPVAQLTTDAIREFARSNRKILEQPGYFLGGWHNPEDGMVYLDISVRAETPEAAAKLAKQHNQIAYFDLQTGKSVKVGGTGGGEQASIRWSGLPEKGRAQEQAARAQGDYQGEARIRKGRALKGKISDTWRRMTGRSSDRIAELKSPQGREIGKGIAEQMLARDEHAAEKASRGTATFERAYNAFERVSKAKGVDVKASWRKVVDALDGRRAENGRLLVGYGDLSGPEKAIHTVTKAIFRQTKKDAIEAGVFTGQQVSSYWPRMSQGAKLEFDDVIAEHAQWLQSTPEGQARLAKLKDKDDTWLKGIIGDDPTYQELAGLDLARNWETELALKKNPHLEKFRGGILKDYDTSPDVVRRYLDGAYQRVAEGRYLGDKAQVIKTAIGELSLPDQEFVKDVFKDNYGPRVRSRFGAGFEEATREANYVQGISKLTNAAIAQLAQPGVAMAHTVGRHGPLGGLRTILQATKQTLGNLGVARMDARRSGATRAADTSETMSAYSAANSYTERFLTDTLKLGKVPVLGQALKSGWFVRDLDKQARVFSDAMGRFGYLEALRANNRKALTEMLGKVELADLALREDRPHVAELEKAITSGRSGDVALEGGYFVRTEKTSTPGGEKLTTSKVDVPSASGFSLRSAVERMDRAGKFVADKTQYRNRPLDAPLVWQSPAMKFAHPFMSFPLQHYYWQKSEINGLRRSIKASDTQGIKQHLGTLVAFNAVFAPTMGAIGMSARSYLQGKGTESKQVNEHENAFVQLMHALGPDPIDNADWDAKLLALEGIQAWNFAGGIGIPLGMVERGTNAFISESSYGDTGRAFANAAGANAGTVYDTGVATKSVLSAVMKWIDGKDSKADWAAVQKAAARMTSHVPILNAPLGIGSGVRAQLTAGKGRKPVSPGWVGLRDKGATWDPKRGVSSPETEAQRERNRRLWSVEDARERRRARPR